VRKGSVRLTALAVGYIRPLQGGAMDSYVLDPDEQAEAGGQALVAMAKNGQGSQVAIKFFDNEKAFQREVAVYTVMVRHHYG
jgi:hypothetical protein